MAYQLNYAGNNTTLKRRIAPFPLPTNFTQDLRVDITFIHANSGSWQAYLNTPDTVATNNTFFLIACDSSNAIYFYSGGAQLNTGVTAVAGQVYTVSVTVSTSKVVGISVNGGVYNTASYPNLNASLFGQLLFGATTNSDGSIYRDTFIGQLRRVETWVGGAKTGDYKNTTGAGTTLVNSIGGAIATQAGTWPADNSEWVFYSSGSSYSDTLSGTAFTSSIGSLTSSRAKADTLSGAIYSSSVGNLAATRGYASTLSGISLSSSIRSLTATRGYSSVLNASTYLSSISSLTSTITSASGYDSLLDGLLHTSSLGNMLSTVQRASVLNGIAFNSSFGSLTTGLGYNSALSGAVYSSSIGVLTSTRSGEVTVTIEGYTIKFADSAIAAAYANNGISAGYAADILEITWQH